MTPNTQVKPPKPPKPSKPVNSYCVKIPKELWESLEAARKARLHNKTAAVLTMAELYLKQSQTMAHDHG